MQFRQAIITIDGQTHLLTPGKSNSFDAFFADVQANPIWGEHIQKEGMQYVVFLHPKQDVVVQCLEIQFDTPFSAVARFFANGFSSWSESHWLPLNAQMPRLRRVGQQYYGYEGDERFSSIPAGKGRLHSWSYTVLSEGPEICTLLGSLNERTGFTLFLYDHARGVLTVRKDLENLSLSHSFPALDVAIFNGKEEDVYAAWFQMMGRNDKATTRSVAKGWTSEGHKPLSDAVLQENLDAFAETLQHGSEHENGPATNFFLIADGWQQSAGDWLSVQPGITADLGKWAWEIKQKGLIPAIWLAPFVAATSSDIVKKHPDWLLKDVKNKPIRAGRSRQDGAWMYALDFYHSSVQSWLAGVFHMLSEKWQFEQFHLDYLYAACLAPPSGKTRGQVMHDALLFLKELLGGKRLVAAAVPLGTALELADVCRLGRSEAPVWEDRLSVWLRRRQRPGALATLRNVLHHWRMQGIWIDPGPCYLGIQHKKLTPFQQQTVLIVNVLLGNMLYTSDALKQWISEEMTEYTEAMALCDSRVQSVSELETDLFAIHFEHRGDRFTAYCNLSGQKRRIPLMELEAYETIVLGNTDFAE
ncbi:MAG: alpha-galactosidase [Saprospiraceae bacterium]|nr:alpha-galactosidase [Saprospiraceae bacterium]